mmetsp:Transcript_12714/g.37418  ORF Transcript_12714/g.37418 Transcript_12714/m.37418 type:complete len:542 (-) Transcript_12714:137-1762(-)|eukprot:CAMPEP_0113548028 /NCGR_PEP_ID=MMETSP0015_2-20120614/12675_1 /TAXON_ID=2838 /ORGANISM="Odontella" /LENGTH=541 /DNA_ID=CAMNT_0000448631 /DNA_START=26 /DNA_END=1651 /DNA_ORIENTATION=+ /assembly_acc=CAM_ASM_000160
MTGAIAYVEMQRSRNEVNVNVDLAEQRAILAQIERERSTARHPGLKLGSPPSFDEAQLNSPSCPRRRSTSLERSMPPEELSGFASFLADAAEEAVHSSPGAGRASSRYGEEGDRSSSLDTRRGEDSAARRIFSEDEMGSLEPPPAPTAAGAPTLAARPRQGHRESHHRQHMSLPDSGFSSHIHDHSVRFDESASNVQKQRAIMEDIEREQRREAGRDQQERGQCEVPTHRQHKSLSVLDSFGLDDAAVQEQMAILREIERQQQQEQQQHREQEEEKERPVHRLSKSVPAEFFDDTCFEEKRAILERIGLENRGAEESQDSCQEPLQEVPKAPTHRHSKSFPAPRSSIDSLSSPDASKKIAYRPSGKSSSKARDGNGDEARRTHLMSLDERVERKRGQFGRIPDEGSLTSSPATADRRRRHTEKDPRKNTSAVASHTPSRHAASFAEGLTASSNSSGRARDASPGDATNDQDTYRRTGRHTVLLVDGREAVARGGGRKKSVTCAGCCKRLSVSWTCEVVFCPRCETLTPAALSDEVGAWGQS